MIRTVAVSCAIATVTGLVAFAQDAQRPVFQTASDLVAVDVFVQTGGKPVAGLTAADFTLADNGTRQRISVSMSRPCRSM